MTGSALFFSSYGCLLIINTDLASYCSPPFSLPLSQVDIKSIPCLFAHLGPQTKLPIITTTTRRRRHLIMIATLWTLLMSFEMRKERERERENANSNVLSPIAFTPTLMTLLPSSLTLLLLLVSTSFPLLLHDPLESHPELKKVGQSREGGEGRGGEEKRDGWTHSLSGGGREGKGRTYTHTHMDRGGVRPGRALRRRRRRRRRLLLPFFFFFSPPPPPSLPTYRTYLSSAPPTQPPCTALLFFFLSTLPRLNSSKRRKKGWEKKEGLLSDPFVLLTAICVWTKYRKGARRTLFRAGDGTGGGKSQISKSVMQLVGTIY